MKATDAHERPPRKRATRDHGRARNSADGMAFAPGSLAHATKLKYEYIKEDDVRAPDELRGSGKGGGELVGGEKVGRKQALDQLTRVFLPDAGVRSAGAPNEISEVCPSIEELDLEGNPLESWEPVVAIAVQLPQLHWLGLNRLALAPLAALPDGFARGLGGLRALCLNATRLEWRQLLFLASAMPQLAELHFNSNGVASLEGDASDAATAADPPPLWRLRTLFLEDNALDAWASLAPLAALPELECLNLNGNRIAAVPPAPDGFGALRHLMLRGNAIGEWASVDALDRLPQLRELRLDQRPLTAELSAAVARRTAIGRVGRLAALNGSEVRVREREDAERFYLRMIAEEYPEGGLPADTRASLDALDEARTAGARRRRRVRRLGEAARGRGVGGDRGAPPAVARSSRGTASSASPRAAASAAARSRTSCSSSPSLDRRRGRRCPPVSRKLPGGLPLKSVKMIACQLFKVEPTRQQLLYQAPGDEKGIPSPSTTTSARSATLASRAAARRRRGDGGVAE